VLVAVRVVLELQAFADGVEGLERAAILARKLNQKII
jgi:hypothetical protein